MPPLVLFDIDGTLIHGASPKSVNNLYAKAVTRVLGHPVTCTDDFAGSTDQLILLAYLRTSKLPPVDLTRLLPLAVAELETLHASNFDPASVVPVSGAADLLAALVAENCKLGLVTGRLQSSAKRLLSAVSLWHYFGSGGFGSDPHTARSGLVTTALRRAAIVDTTRVVLVGDTIHDIAAAKSAGIRHTIGVSNGYKSSTELLSAGPSLVADDLVALQPVLLDLVTHL